MSANTKLTFKPVSSGSKDNIAVLALARPDAANAFNAEMIGEITTHLKAVEKSNARALILYGVGKNFCAGADLQMMQNAQRLTFDGNKQEGEKLLTMYEVLSHLPMPTVAITQGAIYGGGVGLVACCDFAIATDNSKFCLSEVKVGLIPAVIVPYLGRKMSTGQLRRHGLSARVFSAQEAVEFGIAEICVAEKDLANVVRQELNNLLIGGPAAQIRYKKLLKSLAAQNFEQCADTAKAIAEVRTSPEGQAGLAAFIDKKKAPWLASVSADWTWHE